MQHAFRGRGWRATFVLCLVGSLVTPVAAHATASVATMPPGPFDIAPSINTSTVPTAAAVTINTVAMATSTPAPLGAMSTEATSTLVAASPNADLGSRDSSTAQYTQSDANHVTLRLYNAPVGYPDQGQWRLRDPRLSVAVGQGPVAPSHVPFSLQIAQNDGSFQVATLTTPDGTTLGLSLPTMGRRAPTPVRGRVGEDGVTYPSPTSANDVTLKPTLSGIDLGLIIHNPSDAATMAVPLILDPRTHLVSQANGAVLVVRPITDGAANGSPLVLMDAPEYVVGSAVALDSAPLAQTDSGPVTTTVQTDQGQPRLSIHLDPAWLHAAGRQFPVYLTVPILTAFSAMESGTFGTTNSCAPTTPMVSADAVVGTHGPCAYQGYLDFDINALRPGTQITAASLRLYTPDRSGPTAVQVYRNVGAANTLAVPSWAPPNWQTAPVSSGPGIVESAGGTQWHSWDVTSIVQDWIQDRSTKQGFTLRGDGAPIVFATAGGSGVTDPAVVPYLDITYAPTMAPLFSDPGVTTIYGVSGAFTADSYGCPTPGAVLSCDGAINVSTVAHNLGGAYIRFGASLPCQGPPNDTTWWDGTGANKDNKGSLHDILNSAINDGVIPIVNFLPNGCSTVLSSAQWQQAMQNFVSYLRGTVHYPQSRMIYFEIGNEENMFHKSYGDYPTIFAGAASGLESSLDTSPQYVNYRILTGGMITPSATSSCQDSTVWRDPSYPANIQMASAAITAAKNNGVQQSHLAVAVHPYHYQNSQSNSADWQNFYHNAGTGPTDPCSDLWSMIGTWEGLGLPVIFTEDNWADQPKDNAPADQQRNTVAKGSYLVDLFTWLHRHQLDVSSSGVRVLIFRGADTPLPPDMGIYSPNGSTNDHMVTISSTLCLNGNVAGTHSIASNFVQLLHSGCNETVEPAATNTPTPTKATSTPTATATNTPTNTPTPTLVPVKRTVGYVYPGDNSQHVFSISADGHIHEYYGTSSWQDNDLSNLTGAPAAAVGSGLAATVYSYDQSQHVDYITPDGHVHELAWQPNGQWRESDLSSITGASPATPGTSLATYVYPPDASSASMRHVDYISTDGHIHDLLCPSDNNWQNQDLSSMTGAPTASVGSGLDGYAFAYDNSQHVNYTTSDGHIHEIFWNGLWHTSDLSSQVGTSPAMRGSTLAAYAYPNTTASNAMMHVQFISQDGHVHELLWTTDAVWHDNDLSTITGAPTAASGAALDAYVLDYNNTQHVNYTTSDGHIHELFTNGVWHHMDLTSIAGGTGAAVGSGLDGYSYPDDTSSDAEMHVNFIGSDGHVHELLWTANGVWHNDDLTTMASPPRLASLSTRLSGYTVVYDNSQREDYVSSDGHIHELRWRNGWWQDTDLSGLLNAPPDMIGSGLASYARPNDATSNAMMHVFYISTDGHIHELLWSTNGGWLNNDLSSVTGAPAAASGSGLTAYLFAHDNSQHIDYTSTDGHIHEIFDNGMWHNMDLSAMAGAAPALLDGTIAGYAFPNDTSSNAMMHVDYISLDGHIHELQWTSDAVWHNNDLSTITDAPAASLSSGLDSYTFAWDNSQHVNYMTPDGHIHELYANGSWHSSDLSSQVGAQSAIPGSMLAGYASPNDTTSNALMHVDYIGTDNHVHELLWTANGAWHNDDLTTMTGGQLVGSSNALDAYVFASDNNSQHVNYVSADGHVHELYANGSWHDDDLNAMAVPAPPPSSPSPTSIPTNTSTATNTPTVSPTVTSMATPASTPTWTAISTSTNTATGVPLSATPTASATSPVLLAPTATNAPNPPSGTPTTTPSSTATLVPTSTSTNTPVPSLSPTPSSTPTMTAASTSIPWPTNSPIPPTGTPTTSAATSTPTSTNTTTPVPALSFTPTSPTTGATAAPTASATVPASNPTSATSTSPTAAPAPSITTTTQPSRATPTPRSSADGPLVVTIALTRKGVLAADGSPIVRVETAPYAGVTVQAALTQEQVTYETRRVYVPAAGTRAHKGQGETPCRKAGRGCVLRQVRRRVVRTVVLSQTTVRARADRRGHVTSRMHLSYRPRAAIRVRLVVTVRALGKVSTRSMPLIVLLARTANHAGQPSHRRGKP